MLDADLRSPDLPLDSLTLPYLCEPCPYRRFLNPTLADSCLQPCSIQRTLLPTTSTTRPIFWLVEMAGLQPTTTNKQETMDKEVTLATLGIRASQQSSPPLHLVIHLRQFIRRRHRPPHLPLKLRRQPLHHLPQPLLLIPLRTHTPTRPNRQPRSSSKLPSPLRKPERRMMPALARRRIRAPSSNSSRLPLSSQSECEMSLRSQTEADIHPGLSL